MKWTKGVVESIRGMIERGDSRDMVASHFGVSVAVIGNVMSINKIYVKSRVTEKGKTKKEDLATRIRILKGEEIRISHPIAFFTDDILHTFK